MDAVSSQHQSHWGLFTDLYEMTMAQAYLREGMTQPAVFELFFRQLPVCRNYVVAAGVNRLIEILDQVTFSAEDLHYLRQQGQFDSHFLDYLESFRFTGDLFAMQEGTVVFPHEPIVQVVAPLPMAQLIETVVLNQVHFASVVASKAARIVRAADGRNVVDFGSRRAHGLDAALATARATYLVGGTGTSLVLAGQQYGIPILGTMAHSYIQAHENELDAFRVFSEQYPQTTLLVDTYDTLQGVKRVIALHDELGEAFRVRAIRLDSGDLAELACDSRRLLDEAGLHDVKIFASGGLDEYKIRKLTDADTPIDGFGVGTALAVSEEAPALDMAYKLVEYDAKPRTKLSSKKVIYPGRKQVFRQYRDGALIQDTIGLQGESCEGDPLLHSMILGGERQEKSAQSLADSRAWAISQLDGLPLELRWLAAPSEAYPVHITRAVNEALNRLEQSFYSA